MKLFRVKFLAEGTVDVQAHSQMEAEDIAMTAVNCSGFTPIGHGWEIVDETEKIEDDEQPDFWLKTGNLKT